MKIYNLIYTRLLEHILLENRIDFLKNQFRDKLPTNHDRYAKAKTSDEVVDFFANNADPSKNKMFTQWILNQYRAGAIRQEDYPRIGETLTNFEKYKPKLEKKDINQYKSLNDVEDAIEPLLGQAVSKKQETKQVKSEGAVLIHKEGPITVHKLLTQDAACFYGAGTKWCTAAKQHNAFEFYNREGPLYVIQVKNKSGKIAKFQFHPASKAFMDARDKSVNINAFVEKNPQLLNAKEINIYFAKYYDSPEKIMQGLQHEDETVQLAAVSSLYITPELLSKALEHKSLLVREKAAQHPNMTSQLIAKALDDENQMVRLHAIKNPKATSEDIIKALDDTSGLVIAAATQHQNIDNKVLEKALKHRDWFVRSQAVKHPIATNKQITKALNDPNDYVREIAKQRLETI